MYSKDKTGHRHGHTLHHTFGLLFKDENLGPYILYFFHNFLDYIFKGFIFKSLVIFYFESFYLLTLWCKELDPNTQNHDKANFYLADQANASFESTECGAKESIGNSQNTSPTEEDESHW